ncbi:hypothetical protein POM88_006813 [Heracleum sosnowskyi]|uniref:Uncharacterized protein n=1 Tax=Heracleum sosnowskyi TaxID=360622 RepID=A0AAD8J393_9APIA|nr:hypothetical protein POM88_006813 [Heracleum sosnowskyi]
MDMKYLRKEWSMILDVMVKVFSTKTTGWNGFPTYIKKLTHFLVHGYKVDVGKLLMAHLKAALVPNLDFPFPSGYETFTLEDEAGLDPNSANPHSTPYIQPRFSRLPKVQRQALQESRKRSLETDVGGSVKSQEGVPAPSAANKEGSQTEPIVVPLEPKKKRARRAKTTVSHPAVSQKTVEENRAVNTSLDVPSQQGTSIEIVLSPRVPCTESSQPHVPTHEEPPLAETHMESGHSEDFTSQIDASQVPSVEQPLFTSPPSPSSFPTHSFVSSPQPREGDNPNPSGFDHPSPIMDEPPSSGQQEPISQSEMDTTPSNTEKEQGATLSESEIASALFNLQGASYLREYVVIASVVVKDYENVDVKDSVKVAVTTNPAVQAAMEPTINLSTDSNNSGKATVTSAQPNYDEVLIEDVSDDDVPLSQFLKVHSKPYISLHVTAIDDPAPQEPLNQSLGEGIAIGMVPKEPFSQRENEDINIPATQEPSSQCADACHIATASEEFPDNAQRVSGKTQRLVEDTVTEGSTQEPLTQSVKAASEPHATQEPSVSNPDASLSNPDGVAPDASGAPDAEPILIQPPLLQSGSKDFSSTPLTKKRKQGGVQGVLVKKVDRVEEVVSVKRKLVLRDETDSEDDMPISSKLKIHKEVADTAIVAVAPSSKPQKKRKLSKSRYHIPLETQATAGKDISIPDEQSNPDAQANPDKYGAAASNLGFLHPLEKKRKAEEKVFQRQKKLKGSSPQEPESQCDSAASEDPAPQEPLNQSLGEGIAIGMVPQEPFSQRENENINIPATQEPSSQCEDAGHIATASEEFPDNTQGVSGENERLLEDTVTEGSTQEPLTQSVKAASEPHATQEPSVSNPNAGLSNPDGVAPNASGAPDTEPILI